MGTLFGDCPLELGVCLWSIRDHKSDSILYVE